MNKTFFLFLFLLFLVTACTAQQSSQPARVNIGVDIKPGEVKTFSEKLGAEICTQDNKPIIRLFSTTWCPHCKWIKERFDTVVQEYVDQEKIIAHHWEVDIGDDLLTSVKENAVPEEELAIFKQFNAQQSIPTFVMGCKWYRIGNGYESQNDLDAEETELRTVIEKLIAEVNKNEE